MFCFYLILSSWWNLVYCGYKIRSNSCRLCMLDCSSYCLVVGYLGLKRCEIGEICDYLDYWLWFGKKLGEIRYRRNLVCEEYVKI